MSVTVDHETLAADQLGLRTVGQVLSHVQRENRLVTNMLIDGQAPNLDQLGVIRQASLHGHTLFIETADPAEMALDAIAEVEAELSETDRLRTDAIDLLQQGHANRAMEKLSGCFGSWHVAQESVMKIAQLLRIDLDGMQVWDRPLTELVQEFALQLRQIKTALEHRDFVTLCDILTYEATETSNQWRTALSKLRQCVTGL